MLALVPGLATGADNLESVKADVEEFKRQVREANEWKKADSVVHLAGYGSAGYTDRRNSENGTFNVGSFSPIFHYQ